MLGLALLTVLAAAPDPGARALRIQKPVVIAEHVVAAAIEPMGSSYGVAWVEKPKASKEGCVKFVRLNARGRPVGQVLKLGCGPPTYAIELEVMSETRAAILAHGLFLVDGERRNELPLPGVPRHGRSFLSFDGERLHLGWKRAHDIMRISIGLDEKIGEPEVLFTTNESQQSLYGLACAADKCRALVGRFYGNSKKNLVTIGGGPRFSGAFEGAVERDPAGGHLALGSKYDLVQVAAMGGTFAASHVWLNRLPGLSTTRARDLHGAVTTTGAIVSWRAEPRRAGKGGVGIWFAPRAGKARFTPRFIPGETRPAVAALDDRRALLLSFAGTRLVGRRVSIRAP
jgi:hypothetical protein